MIVPSKFNGYNKDGTRNLFMGGGGGGGPTQTTSTVQNTNVPDYAKGYVENMLGATQKQLFNTSPDTTKPILNAEGAPVLDANGKPTYETSLDSFRGYQAYGGTYDQNKTLSDGTPNPNYGNQLSYDPTKGIAGYSPMQVAAQQGISNLALPQEMKDASEATKLAFHDARRLGQSYQTGTYGNQFNSPDAYGNTSFGSQYISPTAYDPGTFGGQQVNASMLDYLKMDDVRGLNTAYANNTNLGYAPTANAAFGNQATLNAAPTAQTAYGTQTMLNAAPTSKAAFANQTMLSAAPTTKAAYGTEAILNAAPTAQAAYGTEAMLNAAPTYAGQQLNYQPTDVGYQGVNAERVNALPFERLQMQAAGNVGTGSFTQPGAANQYMSPYMQSVVNTQQREAQRQADISTQSRGATAARSGAFGGSRQAIENAEASRNLATQKGDIQAQGLQSAFQQAQQQYNTEQQAALQAGLSNQQVQQQTGVQNLSALLQTQGLAAQTGLSAQTANQQAGLQANLANQAAGIDTSKFNQQQQYNTALQNTQLAQQQQLANQSLQGQYGLQQGQMSQQMALANLNNAQQTGLANQALQGQYGIQQGQMTQQMALANQANEQQAGLANQALQGQYGLQQGQMGQQMSLANLNNAQQTGLANQALQGQYGLQQGQMGQQIALADQANRQQGYMANQALQGQYGLQQGQFGQQMALSNQANTQQANLANQALQGQYGLQQGQMGQTVNLANQAAQNQANAQNQQMSYNVGQQNLAAKLGVQQLGSSQNLQAALANQQNQLAAQQAYEQSRQYGAGQGQTSAQLAAQYGLSAQQAAEQSKQFGSNQGLNAAQLKAQYGLAGQQLSEQAKQFGGQYGLQANAQALGAANQYGALGNQALQAQQGIYGLQNQVGGQQQAYQQSILNQSIQDYANAQQYPLMQLGTMSNMLRGLPMQASTTNQYAASPNPLSQAIGTIGAGASIYNATKPGGAAGGLPSEFKYAKGGITSVPRYDMGGEVESQLENMDEKGLQAQAKESSSPSIRRMAQRLLRERQMGNKPQGTGPMGVQYQAAQPQMPSYKPGGIVAFVTGGGANEEGGEEEARRADISGKTMEQRLATAAPATPPAGGIMAAAPVTQVRPEPSPINVQPGGVVTPAMAQMQNRIIAQQATVQKDADRTVSERVAEKEALLGPNTGREDMRAQEMARRANTADEVSRQKSLRLAEFFASWGSTPGPVLVAGMNALKQSIPNIISDEKEAKKLQRESDKIIYDLDQATRLEKQGNIKDSTADKNDAAKRAEDLNKTIAQIQERQMTAEASIKVGQLHKEGAVESAQIRAAQDKLNRAAQLSATNETKIFGQYQTAVKQYELTKEFVAKQESSDVHKEDLKKLANYAASAANKKTGEINPEKIPASYKVPYAETLKRIEDRKEGWNTAIEEARKDKNMAAVRIKNLSSEAVEARTGPKATATDSGAGTTGDFKPPNTAQIAALKTNPQQAAAFDAKFGPGAAAEYLGR